LGKINDPPPPTESRVQRKHRRFPVSYPVHVKWLLEGSACEVHAVTKNVSVGGLLLDVALAIPQYCPVEFTMMLHGGHVTRPIPIMGEGHVVRVEPYGPGAGFAVAIKCKREIELNLAS
jgi:PilZ domain